MRYHVILDSGTNSSRVAVVELPAEGASEARIDGRVVQVDVVPIGRQFSVRVGARIVDLTLDGALPDLTAVANGQRWQVRAESERASFATNAARAAQGAGDRAVRSPMPGRVVRVLVAKGDTVQPGQGLVVLEAMKMENELRARAGGTVANVHVTEGTAVERNAILITLA